MDENKSFSAGSGGENTKFPDTDTANSNEAEPVVIEQPVIPGADNNFQTTAQHNGSNNAKSNKTAFIMLPVLIAAVIFAVVLIGFGIFRAFGNTSVVGTWTIHNDSTADEASEASADEASSSTIYYTFEDDGTAYLSLGTMKAVGTYTISKDENNSNIIDINVPNAITGSFTYNVTGNIFSGRTLELTESTYGQSLAFDSAALAVPELKPYDDFKPSEELTGNWVFDAEYYVITYELRADGTCTINQADMLYTDGVYKATDNTITIMYYAAGESTMELTYKIEDDGSLILNDMQQFVKQESTSEE